MEMIVAFLSGLQIVHLILSCLIFMGNVDISGHLVVRYVIYKF